MTPEELGRLRQGAHAENTTRRFYDDPTAENTTGAGGELQFQAEFGLRADLEPRPYGDGGHDFLVTLRGKRLRIDVKTARVPAFLLVKERDMARCADILVLYQEIERGRYAFIGWDTRDVMELMPKRDFGYGIVSHYRPRAELRPRYQLRALLKDAT